MIERKAEVCLHWGVEKHLKHDCDRLFGWFRTGVKKLVEDGATITEVPELQRALQQHFTAAKTKDVTAPLVKVLIDNDAPVPAVLRRLEIPDFKISRTYCMSAKPCAYSYLGVAIYNHTYSSRPCNVRLYPSEVKETPGPAAWRRGFYGPGAKGVEHGAKASGKGGRNYIDFETSCPASSLARAQATATWFCY